MNFVFLNGALEEEVYEIAGHEDKVCRLRKALYDLKQGPRAWYGRIDGHFSKNGFQKCPSEPTMYVKSRGTCDTLFICLYLDDLIYTSNCDALLHEFKQLMKD